MLANGQINAGEAEELLRALGGGKEDPFDIGRTVSEAVDSALGSVFGSGESRRRHRAGRHIARSLRIVIDSGDEENGRGGRTAVTVPLALAKFAGKLIPEEVRVRLDSEGIQLTDLLEALDEELPEGRLVDIDTGPVEGGQRSRIIVEVA